MLLTDVLDDLDIKYCQPGTHHHVREGWIGLNCPWCPPVMNGKGMYRLGINVQTGRVNCWVCGHHSLESALVAIGQTTYKQVRSLLSGIKLKRPTPFQDVAKTGKLTIPNGVGALQKPHRQYLIDRGFDPDTIENVWKVQGIGISSKYSWRIFIPVQYDGKTVTWTTRSISHENGNRYYNADPSQESIPIKDTIYGIDMVRDTVIITEGPTDVWRIGPGAVAIFGSACTYRQLEQLRHFPRRVICLDNERQMQGEMSASCKLERALGKYPGETYNVRLDAPDPGSASKQEIRELRKAVLD